MHFRVNYRCVVYHVRLLVRYQKERENIQECESDRTREISVQSKAFIQDTVDIGC